MRILVTAAGGKQGKILIPKLAAAGHTVRAARVSAGKDEELRRLGADEVFVGDLTRVDVYTAALRGCDAVYHVGPTGLAGERASGFAMIEGAKRCGTRHVVFSSVYHTIIDILQHRYKRDIEEALVESGLNWTVLRPCDYMMVDYHVNVPRDTGTLPVLWRMKPGRRESLIDIEDLTDVAAKVLVQADKHFFADYELAGPDKLTSVEMVRILSREFGREISAVQITPEDYMESVFGVREPTPELQHMFEMFRSIAKWYSQFDFIGNPNVLEWLLGRKPTAFAQFVRRTLLQQGAVVSD